VTDLQITEISQFHSKQDMSRWTRAHAEAPGITWSVYPGPGGTMIVVEHEEDRAAFLATEAAQHVATAATEVTEAVPAASAGSFLDFANA
jgi:hypothetical protein